MAVLIRNRIEGMSGALYDQISPPLLEKLRSQPGFVLHASYETADGGFIVAEIWETAEQHAYWFDRNVKPNLQAAVEHEVIELHSVYQALRHVPRSQGLPSIHPA